MTALDDRPVGQQRGAIAELEAVRDAMRRGPSDKATAAQHAKGKPRPGSGSGSSSTTAGSPRSKGLADTERASDAQGPTGRPHKPFSISDA